MKQRKSLFICIAILVSAFIFSLLGLGVYLRNYQHPAEKLLRKYGGHVQYNKYAPIPRRHDNAMRFLEKIIGETNYGYIVERIHVYCNGMQPGVLGNAISCGTLYGIDIAGRDLFDNDLKYLPLNERIKYISIYSDSLTNTGVLYITKCENVVNLTLMSDGITGECLEHISKMKKVRRLAVDSENISDSDVAPLTDMPKLIRLWLTSSQITDEVLNNFEGIKRPLVLDLTNTQVTMTAAVIFMDKRPNVIVLINDDPLRMPIGIDETGMFVRP